MALERFFQNRHFYYLFLFQKIIKLYVTQNAILFQ